ncbi:hypothetical protein VTL71DRAFT_2530 [Oculimacula yallundae]|uniref:Uncharacterized protein n=1 Tax=Oculimacula yallundae TaxID=86028 RepID=A0ABR4C951_9HELO
MRRDETRRELHRCLFKKLLGDSEAHVRNGHGNGTINLEEQLHARAVRPLREHGFHAHTIRGPCLDLASDLKI